MKLKIFLIRLWDELKLILKSKINPVDLSHEDREKLIRVLHYVRRVK